MIYRLMEDIGNQIKEIRKVRGYTQRRLSEAVGISQKHLNLIENGKVFPNWKMLTRILKILRVRFQLIINA